MSGGAGNAGPTGDHVRDLNDPCSRSGNGDGATWKPRKVKAKVRGADREIDIPTPEKELELLQKGAAFEDRNEEVNLFLRQEKAKMDDTVRQLQPLLDIDRQLREDSARGGTKAKKIAAILNDQALSDDGDAPPAGDPLANDPLAPTVKELQRQVRSLTAVVERGFGTVREDVGSIRRRESYRDEERVIRRRYGKLATDDRLDRAMEVAERDGMKLEAAFKVVAFDEVPEVVRAETLQEFDIDPTRHSPGRSEAPVIEGLGPLTDQTLSGLYANPDPDTYARFRPAIREAKRRRRGLTEIPR